MIVDVRERLREELAKESLFKAGRLRLRVTGTSMLPAIRPRAYVSIRKVGPEFVAAGDILLTDTASGLRLHRLVEIRPGPVFVTRGDNHRHDDPPVTRECLLGKVEAMESVPGFLRRLFSWRLWERLAA